MKDEDGAKEDSCKLNHLVLEENVWKLLEEIVKTFKPFDELTTYLVELNMPLFQLLTQVSKH